MGNVELRSDAYFLSAGDVEFSTINQSTKATDNVKFQDSSYFITGEQFSANMEENNIMAVIDNARYQEIKSNANGTATQVVKTENKVIFNDATYSFCPINQNDWQIRAATIEANLDTNRGIADHATMVFMGYPIFYLPKYSWVLEGRGSGFLTFDFHRYTESNNNEDAYLLRVPYYLNLAPDRDLVLAYTFISTRGSLFEGKYRQLIKRNKTTQKEYEKTKEKYKDSTFDIETQYLFDDEITNLNRWLLNTNVELDLNNKTHLSSKYYRVSDSQYFKEILHSDTTLERLNSHTEIIFTDPDTHTSASALTNSEQVVNDGIAEYTKDYEFSLSRTLNAEEKMPTQIDLVTTKFGHHNSDKQLGTRTHANLGVTRSFETIFPEITTRANISSTYYQLTDTTLTRTTAGAGVDFAFPFTNQAELFNTKVNHTLTPIISYNYRAKELQGNIPIFDTTDKFDDIITFTDLTSGERYTGLDRVTNANDFTLSLESSFRKFDSKKEDLDLFNFRIAQSYYADTEVVSDTSNINYETRRSYSDIAASVDLAVSQFVFGTAVQFDPEISKITKTSNEISYKSNPRKFISLAFEDNGSKTTAKLYGAFPVNDSIHLFAGIDKTTSTGVTNQETTGFAYESCCWALRFAHFKESSGTGYAYSTGMELVFKGLGSTATNLKDRIERNIPYYKGILR